MGMARRMTDLNLSVAHPTFKKFVEHYDCDEAKALMRLDALMRMDMAGPMPDEVYDLDVSSELDRERIEKLEGLVKDDAPARLIVGGVYENE